MFNSKKVLLCLAVTSVVMVFTTGMAFAESLGVGRANEETVNVRSKATTDSTVVEQLSKGDKVVVKSKADGWYSIETVDGTDGWVRADLLEIVNGDAARLKTIGTGTVTGGTVNVREEASTECAVLTQVSEGTKVSVLGRSEDWYKVQLSSGTVGWINATLIDVKLAEQASRGAVQERKDVPKEEAPKASEESADKSDTRSQVVAYAKKFLGVNYVWGGTSPKGFDCSGFVLYVMKNFGVSLDRTSSSQLDDGKRVKKSELRPGDLVFFDTNGRNNGRISHVGIYIGNGKFIHASSGHGEVMITDLDESYYANAYVAACSVLD